MLLYLPDSFIPSFAKSVKAILLPSGFGKNPEPTTPLATATYVLPFCKTTGIFFIVSLTDVLFAGAIPIFNVTSAGTVTKGVAVLKAKLSNKRSPFTYTSTSFAKGSAAL